jgi:hypothetical protein
VIATVEPMMRKGKWSKNKRIEMSQDLPYPRGLSNPSSAINLLSWFICYCSTQFHSLFIAKTPEHAIHQKALTRMERRWWAEEWLSERESATWEIRDNLWVHILYYCFFIRFQVVLKIPDVRLSAWDTTFANDLSESSVMIGWQQLGFVYNFLLYLPCCAFSSMQSFKGKHDRASSFCQFSMTLTIMRRLSQSSRADSEAGFTRLLASHDRFASDEDK